MWTGYILAGLLAVNAGMEAPDFKVKDIYGEPVELSSYRGKKNILIFFSRYIGCSWCQMYIIEIMRKREKFEELNTEVLVVTESEEEVLKKYAPPKEKAFIRMISDPDKKLYRLYDVDKKGKWFAIPVITESLKFLKYLSEYKWIKGGLKGDSFQIPACVIIGKDGRIKYYYRSENIAQHPDLREIFRVLNLLEGKN